VRRGEGERVVYKCGMGPGGLGGFGVEFMYYQLGETVTPGVVPVARFCYFKRVCSRALRARRCERGIRPA